MEVQLKPVALAALLLLSGVFPVAAQHADSPTYSRAGELSPGTQAPSPDVMARTIENGGAEAVFATLEYGERVVCPACVPLLQGKLLGSGSARVREIAAWWLRRQPYASGAVLDWLRGVLVDEGDAQRRARAAEALGEMMDTSSFEALARAARADADAAVRASAVRALSRLNLEAAGGVLAEAFGDPQPSVRLAALAEVQKLNFFSEQAALLPLLADRQAEVRQRAARLLGEWRVVDADTVLAAALRDDEDPLVRQSAAWALGRIGTSTAREALSSARRGETNSRVLDAIEVAERM